MGCRAGAACHMGTILLRKKNSPCTMCNLSYPSYSTQCVRVGNGGCARCCPGYHCDYHANCANCQLDCGGAPGRGSVWRARRTCEWSRSVSPEPGGAGMKRISRSRCGESVHQLALAVHGGGSRCIARCGSLNKVGRKQSGDPESAEVGPGGSKGGSGPEANRQLRNAWRSGSREQSWRRD